MKGKTVLVVDDDPHLLALLKLVFSGAGAEVFTATDGREGLGQFAVCRPDLVVLDIMMPVLDGWETCQLMRRMSDVPIIILSVLSQDDDIVRGLECGAVDVVAKPFSPKVLVARAEAVLRRRNGGAQERRVVAYEDGYLSIDLEARGVVVAGMPVHLTETEYRLLAYLVENAGRVLTYERILERVWGWECLDSVDYVHVYVWHLRRKLEPDAHQPRYVVTEHGVGYRFEAWDSRDKARDA